MERFVDKTELQINLLRKLKHKTKENIRCHNTTSLSFWTYFLNVRQATVLDKIMFKKHEVCPMLSVKLFKIFLAKGLSR